MIFILALGPVSSRTMGMLCPGLLSILVYPVVRLPSIRKVVIHQSVWLVTVGLFGCIRRQESVSLVPLDVPLVPLM